MNNYRVWSLENQAWLDTRDIAIMPDGSLISQAEEGFGCDELSSSLNIIQHQIGYSDLFYGDIIKVGDGGDYFSEPDRSIFQIKYWQHMLCPWLFGKDGEIPLELEWNPWSYLQSNGDVELLGNIMENMDLFKDVK